MMGHSSGLLFASKAIVQMLFHPFVVRYVDQFEFGPVIVGLLLLALSCCMFIISDDYSVWCVSRAISGAGSSLIFAGSVAQLRRSFSSTDQLTTATSTAMLGIVAGIVVGPYFGGKLFESGEKLPYYALLGIIVVAVIAAVSVDTRFEFNKDEKIIPPTPFGDVFKQTGERAKRALKQRRANAARFKINAMGSLCRKTNRITRFARRILSWHCSRVSEGHSIHINLSGHFRDERCHEQLRSEYLIVYEYHFHGHPVGRRNHLLLGVD